MAIKAFDTVIIGSGPAGMTAALYMARFGASVALIEKMTAGGLLLQTYEIENYPGFKTGRGYELADQMEAQLAPYEITRIQSEVSSIENSDEGKKVVLEKETLLAKTVIICSGLNYSKLNVPGEAELIGKGVSYCAICDGNFYRGEVVGVVGGGNSALGEALYLATLAREVHLIHRRDQFRADKIYHDKVTATPNIKIHYSQVVEKINASEDLLASITLRSTQDGTLSDLPLNGLFVFAGYTPSAEFLPDGLDVDKAGFIVTDTEMLTNIPGIYAAGDIRSKTCRQVVTAVGDGATAAHSAYTYLGK